MTPAAARKLATLIARDVFARKWWIFDSTSRWMYFVDDNQKMLGGWSEGGFADVLASLIQKHAKGKRNG